MLKEPSRRAYVQTFGTSQSSATYKLDLSPMEAGRGFPSIGWNGRNSTLSWESKQTSSAAGPATGGQSSGTQPDFVVPFSAEKLNTVREFGRTPYNSETLLTATSSGHGKIGIESQGGLVKRFGRVRGSWGYGSRRACE